ncbi:hypothetical protein F4861DRAFT_534396 [Xylaria intraflava]|nr:hypothetical protein F4861DRAFT_534396 [Xylaria intraflava]
MAPEVSKDAVLKRALDVADEETLRMVLKAMCKESDVCRKAAMDRMLISRKHTIIELSDSSDEDSDAEEKPKKRQKTIDADDDTPVSRYERCETCNEVYDVTLNDKEACQTHEEDPHLDESFFPDDDQVRYDINSIDVHTDWRRDSCPEGFRYECCDEDIEGEPCVIQRHIPKK